MPDDDDNILGAGGLQDPGNEVLSEAERWMKFIYY